MAEFKLDPKEVVYGESGGSTGRRKARLPRSASLTSGEVVLVHLPTEISVSGEVPPGRYTRKRMKELKHRLAQQLWQELTEAVAKKLRVPGR